MSLAFPSLAILVIYYSTVEKENQLSIKHEYGIITTECSYLYGNLCKIVLKSLRGPMQKQALRYVVGPLKLEIHLKKEYTICRKSICFLIKQNPSGMGVH